MRDQSTKHQWLHLRWRQFYQWKNLLDREREVRVALEQQHRQELNQLLSSERWSLAGSLMQQQLTALVQLRQDDRQKRLQLRQQQRQEMTDFATKYGQPELIHIVDRYVNLSVLRRV